MTEENSSIIDGISILHPLELRAINQVFDDHSEKTPIQMKWVFRKHLVTLQDLFNVSQEKVIYGVSLEEAIKAKSNNHTKETYLKQQIEESLELDKSCRQIIAQPPKLRIS